jgi:hypothetical protein
VLDKPGTSGSAAAPAAFAARQIITTSKPSAESDTP